MTSYLIDDGGERTHAVITVEEHERLKKAAERADSISSYARQIMAAMEEDSEQVESNGQEESHERSWHA
jgi:hypothetical protein